MKGMDSSKYRIAPTGRGVSDGEHLPEDGLEVEMGLMPGNCPSIAICGEQCGG